MAIAVLMKESKTIILVKEVTIIKIAGARLKIVSKASICKMRPLPDPRTSLFKSSVSA